MQRFTTEAYETHSQWKCHQRRKFWIKLSPNSFWRLIESNAILYPRRVNTRKRKAEEKKCVKCNIYTFQWVFIIKAHDMMKDYKKLPIAQRSQSIKSQNFLVCPKGSIEKNGLKVLNHFFQYLNFKLKRHLPCRGEGLACHWGFENKFCLKNI